MGSVVKTRADCSCRGLKFTHTDHVTATYNSSFKGSDGFFWPPWNPTQVPYTYIDRRTSVKIKINIFFFYKSQNAINWASLIYQLGTM